MIFPGWPTLLALTGLTLAACGDNDTRGLDDYLPAIPGPTGEAPSVFAGPITADNADAELIPGAASSGRPGDFYLRNARGRYVIQSAARVIGVVPQGGNLVDAQPIGPDGPIGEDHFGELSSIYLLGRTCEHERVDVVQDGSGGGVAAIIARGVSAPNDFLNLRGIGALNVPSDLDPDIPDSIACATTYLLRPESPTVEVYWTFFNGGDLAVRGPFAAVSDTGGAIETWNHGRGFERLGVESIADPNLEPAPTEYGVYQGPGVAYGVVPQHADDARVKTCASIMITGVSILIYGADEIFDILTPEGLYFSLDAQAGVTHGLHFIAAQDAADVEEEVRTARGDAVHRVSGRVTWSSGDPAPGARVGFFRDEDGDGEVGPDDVVVSYAETGGDGRFSARLTPGAYLARADALDRGRSTSMEVDLRGDRDSVDLEMPDPVYFDYSVVDDETGALVPARVIVVGDSPVAADLRLFPTSDAVTGIADVIFSTHGTSVDIGDGADRRIALSPGVDYRVLAAHGTEWSVASVDLSPEAGDPDGEIELRLRRVIETDGYLATEYHVHSIGSFDSAVEWPTRIATAVVDGVELFASTEHDFVADLQPLVESLGLDERVRVLPGIEVTPFAYGHFNAWPFERDAEDPTGGAIDWARGADGFSLVPGELFDRMRDRGAELIQINHPRAVPGQLSDFLQYFDRAGLSFDYQARAIFGDPDEQSAPNEWMRLPPGVSLWDISFNALEVWNLLGMEDTNADGRREPYQLDVVMRDWFNFLSFGVKVAPLANSDTHSAVRDPTGIPRTLVRVDDDSPGALASGAVVASVLDTLLGRGPNPHDLVLTNGPHLRVRRQGEEESAIGQVIAGEGGEVSLDVRVQSPRWAPFDTIEVFANAIPEVNGNETILEPIACFTVVPEEELPPNDPCALAPLGSAPLTVTEVVVAPGFTRYQATASITLSSAQPLYPDGAEGEDVWVVVRVRGDQAIYPVLLGGYVGAQLPTFVAGSQAEVDAALEGIGVPATAFTAPIYLDLDGGGYRAPFAPE